jgi:hypothetical protein
MRDYGRITISRIQIGGSFETAATRLPRMGTFLYAVSSLPDDWGPVEECVSKQAGIGTALSAGFANLFTNSGLQSRAKGY